MKRPLFFKPTMSLKIHISVFLLILSSFALPLKAMEIKANLFSETEYTSNSKLDSFNTKEDIIERLGLSAVLSEERKRFNANARFNLSQEFYFNNTFSDQTQLTTGFGLFNFDIIEDFLDWRTSFTRIEVLSDAAEENTPDNREKRNVFRTGPSINYRINKASLFRFGTNYVQVENSDESAADTKRLEATAGYIYQYNSVTNFGWNAAYDRVIETEENGRKLSNSDEQPKNLTLSVGLNRQFSHGHFNFNIGRNEVHSEDSQKISGNYFDISIQYNKFYYYDIQLDYAESISDSSIGFDTLQSLQENSSPSSLSSSNISSALDIVKRKQFDLAIDRTLDNFHYSINGFWAKDNYEIQPSDEETFGLGLRLDNQFHEAMILSFIFQYEKNKFLDQIELGEDVTSTYTAEGRYQLTKDFSIHGHVGYEKQGNNKSFSREYEDFFLMIGFNFLIF